MRVLAALLLVLAFVASAHVHDDRLVGTEHCALCRVAHDVPAVVAVAVALVALPAAGAARAPARSAVCASAAGSRRARSPPVLV